MIADYDFYRNVYLGEVLIAEDFPRYATRADAYLNVLTYGNYADSSLPEATVIAVKMAECAVADLCFTTETESAVSSAISKETVGSHSVSYLENGSAQLEDYQCESHRLTMQLTEYLLEIAEDGQVRSDEYEDFMKIKGVLDRIAQSVSNLRLWMDEQIAENKFGTAEPPVN